MTENQQPTGSAGPRSIAPLVAGSALLIVGALWLMDTFGLFDHVGEALARLLIFGGLTALALVAFKGAPERRWGFLIPAGTFLGLAVSGFIPQFLEELVFFMGIAAGFIAIYVLEPRRFWAAIVGWIFVATALANFTDVLGLGFLGGAVVLWSIAAIFAWHFLQNGAEWAILPGGGLVTMGVVSTLNWLEAPVLFFGFAATFALYYLLGKPGKVGWAAIPAIVLAVIGLICLVTEPNLMFMMPLLLIGFGLYLIVRSQRDVPLNGNGSDDGAGADAPG